LQVQEQLIKLLKSLGVITTREYVEAVEDIGMLKPGNAHFFIAILKLETKKS